MGKCRASALTRCAAAQAAHHLLLAAIYHAPAWFVLAAYTYRSVSGIQVHGHDFSCVSNLPTTAPASFRYASGSEEKVVRIFEAPQAFLDTFSAMHAPAGTGSSITSHPVPGPSSSEAAGGSGGGGKLADPANKAAGAAASEGSAFEGAADAAASTSSAVGDGGVVRHKACTSAELLADVQGRHGAGFGAAVAALGLTNKAVFEDQLQDDNAGKAAHASFV